MQELNFTNENGYWVSEYSGDAGAIQLLFDKESQIEFLGDAGLGIFTIITNYNDKLCLYRSKHLLKYIDMTGINKLQIRCSEQPIKGIINT